jgi:GTP-binding protein
VPSIGGTPEEIYEKYTGIRKELTAFGAGLEEKSEIVVLSKIDLVDEELVKKIVAFFKKKKVSILPLSAANGAGIKELIGKLAK